MPLLDDVRAKYPVYKDWSDEELAEGLRTKFYADMPSEQYYAKIGMKEPGIQGFADIPENIGQGFNRAIGTALNAAGYAAGGFLMGDTREEQARHPLMYAGQVLKGERDIPGMEGTRFARPAVTPGERIFQAGGEAVAAGVPLAGGVAAVGRNIAKPVGNAAQQIAQRIAQEGNRAMVAKPAAAAGLEVSAGTGAGAGEEVGEGIPFLPEPVGRTLGGLAGGAAASFNLPRLAIKAGGKVVNVARGMVSPTVQTQRAKQIVAKQLGPELQNAETQTNMQRAQQLRQQIPGFNPDLAEATQSPALIATKSDIQQQSRGADLDAQRARARVNQRSVKAFAEKKAPRGQSGRPDAVFEPMLAARHQDALALRDLQEQKEGLKFAQRDMPAKVSAMADDLRRSTVQERGELAQSVPRIDRVRVGQELRADIQAERSRRAQEIGREFKQLEQDGLDFKAPFSSFQTDIRGWENGLSITRQENLPQSIMRDIEAIGELNQVPLSRVKQLREDLGHEVRSITAMSDSAARLRAANAQELLTRLDDLVVNADAPQLGGLADRWRAARQRWRTEIIDPFEHGEVLEVRRLDGTGYYRTADEDLALKILGKSTGADQFQDIARTNPRMVENLRGAVLDDLASSAVVNGQLSPAAVRRFSEKYREALDRIPELRSTVDGLLQRSTDLEDRIAARTSDIKNYRRDAPKRLVDTQRQIDEQMQPLLERMGLLAERRLAVEDTMLARRLTSLDRGATTSQGLIDQALKEPVFMQKIVNELTRVDKAAQLDAAWQAGSGAAPKVAKVGGPALAAMRRHVWDSVTRDMDPDKIGEFMEKNRESLKILFTPAHMKNMTAVRDALRIMKGAAVQPGRGKPIRAGFLDRFEMATGMNVPQAASRWRGVHTGRSSKWIEAADSFGRWINKRGEMAMNKVMREALNNPAVAESLAQTLNTSPTGLPTKPLRAWLWRLGISVPVDLAREGVESAQDQ